MSTPNTLTEEESAIAISSTFANNLLVEILWMEDKDIKVMCEQSKLLTLADQEILVKYLRTIAKTIGRTLSVAKFEYKKKSTKTEQDVAYLRNLEENGKKVVDKVLDINITANELKIPSLKKLKTLPCNGHPETCNCPIHCK